jgi:signal transduction histidine kinase
VTRRIFVTILAVTVLAVVLFGVPLAVIADRRIHDDAVIELQRDASAVAVGLPRTLGAGDPIRLPAVESGTRMAVYDRAGHLLTGDGPATADAVVAATTDGRVHDGVVGSERVVAVPVPGDEQSGGAIRAAEPRSEVRRRALLTFLAMAGVGVLAVAVAVAAGLLLGRRLTRPVRRLRDASVRLGQGDFTAAAPQSGVSELDEVADALNATAQRLGTVVERERSFAADASHQLRTPLASLRLALENELADPRPDPAVALCEALTDVDRLEETIERLLSLARDLPGDRGPVELDAVVRDAESRWHGLFASEHRPLRVDVDPRTGSVSASAAAVSTVLDVLLDNALRHGAGIVTISAGPALPAGALVVVGDEGEVTAPDEVLFARRSPEARDHGIGLALARSLAQAEGSRLLVSSRRPTAFELVLPAARLG